MLDPNKLKLIEYLAIPKSLRPMSLKAYAFQVLLVSEPTVHKWKKEPEFDAMLKNVVIKRFTNDISDVMTTLKNRALDGDVRAAKTFLDFVDSRSR